MHTLNRLLRRSFRLASLALLGSSSLISTGCGAAAQSHTGASGIPPQPETPPAFGPAEARVADASPQAAPRAATSPSGPVGALAPAPTASAAGVAVDPELARAKDMIDIEARLRIEVEHVTEVAAKLRDLVRRSGGRIANESTTLGDRQAPQAEFSLRVPVAAADDVFLALDGLGVVRSRSVTAKEIGKEYYDSVVRLRNLQVTRERLEQVLAHAGQIGDVLVVETELTRVRGEMEQIEGQLRFFRDRAAFATITVTLFVKPPEEPVVVPPVVVKPEAKFFPELHLGGLLDVHGDASTRSFYGAGFGVGVSRQFELRLDGFRRLEGSGSALDAFTATLGGRFHSEFLGGGTRRFLDPYLGLRGGYARFEGRSEMLAGVTLGLELWKTDTVRFDLGVDGLALFGSSAGPHAAIAPTLGFDVAF